jgi:hypothetical protein
MPLRLIEQKRTLGLKIETTPYTAETLTVSDYDIQARDISYSPEVEMYLRKLARGDYSRDPSVPGRRKCTVSFKVDMHRGSAAGTPPQYFDALRCCALKQVVHGSTGVSLITDANYDRVPCTIEVVERQEGAAPNQLVTKLHGCMGNAKLVCSQTGQPIAIEFEFTGVLNTPTTRAYASMITPTAFDTAVPSAVLAATIWLYGTDQYLGQFSIDLGNVVELFTDPSKTQGYEGARVVDRQPILELDPDLLVTSDVDHLTNMINATTGALSVTIGQNLYISAPACQIVDTNKPGSREGHVTNQLRLELKRSAGNDELTIRQGSVS